MVRSRRQEQQRFNLNASQVFLTYPRCDITKEDLFNILTTENYGQRIQRIVVAGEKHQDGGEHRHVYIRFGSKIRIRDERRFDISGFHPNIQGCRSVNAVIDYCKKDGEYISREWNGEEYKDWTQKIKRTFADALRESSSFDEFMGRIREASARDYVLCYDRIASFAEREFKRNDVPPYEGHHEFLLDRSCPRITAWKEDNLVEKPDRPMSLLLVSPTRYGKTEWARSLGKHFYMCGMFNLDDFKTDADYAIFDDFTVDQIKYSYKQWMGCQKQFTLTDKYRKKCTVKWGKPAIFLMNCPVLDDIKSQLDFNWIEGNCIIVCLTNKLY